MPWTTPATVVAGQLMTAAFWNTQVRDNLDYLFSTILSSVYPVGSIYTNASVSTNPATLLGFGTWVAHGAGRVNVGFSAGDPDFGTLGATGGAKTHTLSSAEMPSHTHAVGFGSNAGTDAAVGSTGGSTPFSQNTTSTGGGGAHNNLQPFVVVYMWLRTA